MSAQRTASNSARSGAAHRTLYLITTSSSSIGHTTDVHLQGRTAAGHRWRRPGPGEGGVAIAGEAVEVTRPRAGASAAQPVIDPAPEARALLDDPLLDQTVAHVGRARRDHVPFSRHLATPRLPLRRARHRPAGSIAYGPHHADPGAPSSTTSRSPESGCPVGGRLNRATSGACGRARLATSTDAFDGLTRVRSASHLSRLPG